MSAAAAKDVGSAAQGGGVAVDDFVLILRYRDPELE
jgi:hypothetical protein